MTSTTDVSIQVGPPLSARVLVWMGWVPDDLRADYERVIVELRATVAMQADRIAASEAELAKHSGNSSKPPSRDTNEQRGVKKESRAERRAAGRKAGKQRGAPGRHLARVAEPDETVDHRPVSCGGCGAGLDGATEIGSVSRQVFGVPLGSWRVGLGGECRWVLSFS